jgi:hypothetical protein
MAAATDAATDMTTVRSASAFQAIQGMNATQKQTIHDLYGGKASNQFVEDIKAATFFQANWSDLLRAAPTALCCMGSCWLAAANPVAERISLTDAMPVGGFKYMTNLKNPTLRACLVDVCNNGGREAFTVAGKNMEALRITSRRICADRITMVFKRLGPCTAGEYQFEDFNAAVDDFSKDANRCAKLASETREAFGRWAKMVGELNMCTVQQESLNSIHADTVAADQRMTEIEAKLATEERENTKIRIQDAARRRDTTQKLLDIAIKNVPSPWESIAQGAVICYTQTIPTVIASIIPSALGTIPKVLDTIPAAINAVAGATEAIAGAPASAPAVRDDPAYASAINIRDFVNHFYEFLGNDTEPIRLDKFREPTTPSKENTNQGMSYLLGTLNAHRKFMDVSNTEPNKKLMDAYKTLIEVGTEIQEHLRKENEMKADKLDNNIVKRWRERVKQALDDVLSLVASANATSSFRVPTPFGSLGAEAAPDSSGQMARLNTALQVEQMAQKALDNAAENYDAAVAKHEKTAETMAQIESKLVDLQKTGQTLQEIKPVLSKCIAILVDLACEIAKVERFFIMLSTWIDESIKPMAESFAKRILTVGSRSRDRGQIIADDIAKQTIYTEVLTLKGYFSLLEDISSMYSLMHEQYITEGIDLCCQLSKGTASNDDMSELSNRLFNYRQQSSSAIADLVSQKQEDLKNSLKARARRATEQMRMIEADVYDRGITIDTSAVKAIDIGAREDREAAKIQLNSNAGFGSSEDIDCSED